MTLEPAGDAHDPATRFCGAWSLVSWAIVAESGARTQPFGPEATGLLVYSPDGFMSATIMCPGRAPFAGIDPQGGSAAECREALRGYHAYCGRYRIEGARVIHSVTLAAFPNLIGSEQVRHWRFDQGRLILTTPPVARAGVAGTGELVWERAGIP